MLKVISRQLLDWIPHLPTRFLSKINVIDLQNLPGKGNIKYSHRNDYTGLKFVQIGRIINWLHWWELIDLLIEINMVKKEKHQV